MLIALAILCGSLVSLHTCLLSLRPGALACGGVTHRPSPTTRPVVSFCCIISIIEGAELVRVFFARRCSGADRVRAVRERQVGARQGEVPQGFLIGRGDFREVSTPPPPVPIFRQRKPRAQKSLASPDRFAEVHNPAAPLAPSLRQYTAGAPPTSGSCYVVRRGLMPIPHQHTHPTPHDHEEITYIS